MTDDALPQPGAELEVQALKITDELIGLSAELDELRSQVTSALDRATVAAETSQRAEVMADEAASRMKEVSEYVTVLTDGLGAGTPPADLDPSSDPATAMMTRDELIAHIEHLEAVLNRRSVQAALKVTQRLRGS